MKKSCQEKPADSTSAFVAKFESAVGKIDEVARIAGPAFMQQQEEHTNTFSSEMLMHYRGSLFIVAAAGFGKTSFCRWHALDDLERLLQDNTGRLPVYVPLHQLSEVARTFKSTFLGHAGLSALLPKGEETKYETTRVYLDGLDEVPSQALQRRIAQLAHEATQADPALQVIITARDYVYGPWMAWLPRVHLSALDDAQVRELVTRWLDND